MNRLTTAFSLIICLFSASLFAAENTDQSRLTKAYIAGFLAGAQITDSEIIERLGDARKNDQHSDFFRRAFKTRVGERNEKVPATYFAGFCLPEDRVDEKVIQEVLSQLMQTEDLSKSPSAETVFDAVRAKYPC
ncbi:Rap1a/Tai family immunity protein [uncultured Neptuniibacter sp.]|uniref:Rap1a/Tai family immunity protein n=1 Tax=uncultured Neptuniibacter sp. TaxID=502143 RepID=UPI00263670C5|nr:Rap1a/Tai family immunity protein [uncultured Neptuniibacter sp.]